MIQEAYVSYEVAKLLKEKGFPQEKDYAIAMYDEDGDFHSLCTKDRFYYDFEDFDDKDCIAVTQQSAMAWLMEEKNWYVDIRFNRHYQYYVPIIYNMSGTLDAIADLQERPKTYEKAVEAAIKYTLENLIK